MLKNKIRLLTGALALSLLITLTPFFTASAEEGMFMMDKLASLPLAQKGLKIKPADIYNPAGGGLSEAVPRLSSGCSAEFVSPDGLILTNHHCAFDSLVAASTPEKNYGEDGYRAGSRAEELPAKGVSIDIPVKQEDITARVLAGIDRNNADALNTRLEQIKTEEQAKAGADVTVEVQPLTSGMAFYQFNYKTVKDIRIVYAPPKSIGFFGGDPDNFEWTRHVGDFTFMRAYVAPDGKAAEYAANNMPYKPKKHLTISTSGVKENDLTMIIGYPGGTSRYRESYSVAYNQNYAKPSTVDILKTRIRALEDASRESEAKRVKLQSDIFSLANTLKAEEGAIAAMRRANLIKQRQDDEVKLTAWIDADPARKAKYAEALPKLRDTYIEYGKLADKDVILRNITALNAVAFTNALGRVPADRLKEAVPEIAGAEVSPDREVLKFLLRKAAALPADQKIAAIEKRFGTFSGDARIKAEDEFTRSVIETEKLTTEKGLNDLIALPAEQAKASLQPLSGFIADLLPDIAAMTGRQQTLNANVGKYRLAFIQAKTEMKGRFYPDANFTQRFTYGEVKGYTPKQSVTYGPFTTLDGVFEKDTGIPPFNAPAKLRELWEKKDYGTHAVNGSVPLNFLTTNDIIGGNSGSPVLNGNGEQVGIAFDGNYEGLGNDFFFSDSLGRTIIVDIRYVLFITEKFGDAGWILKEMNIKGKAKAAGVE